MGLFSNLFGNTKPVAPKLDQLFALVNGATALSTQLQLDPSGQAGVCFKAGTGGSEATSAQEILDLVNVGAAADHTSLTTDDLGFHWIVVRNDDLGELVTIVHGVHSTLVEHGIGDRLLCSVFGFVPHTPPGDGDVRLVYLAKRGTFYPFAPRANNRRDNELELRVKSFLTGEVPLEPELERWLALWGLPVA